MKNIKIHLNGHSDEYIVRSLHKRNNTDTEQSDPQVSGPCEIVNITLCGALVVVPKHTTIPHKKLKITIPASVMNLTRDTVIDSEIRWSDPHHHPDHTRLGLMFTGMKRAERRELKQLLLGLETPGDTHLPCRLEVA